MLIDEIIANLSRDTGSLNEALLKTKVLLHQIGKKELIEWVNFELNGYPKDAALPDYRVLPAQVVANFSNIACRVSSHPIPLAHLKPTQRKSLETSPMHDPLNTLEEAIKNDAAGLRRNIPMEANSYLSQGLGNGFQIECAWCEISAHSVRNILVQVRSRLLDFLLELKTGIGEIPSEAAMKDKVTSLDATGLFNNTIFGSNTTIVVGHNNVQTVTTTNSVGNLDALSATLRDVGVPENEINELQLAITEDKAVGTLSFGGRVGDWLTHIIERAAQGRLTFRSTRLQV